MTTTLRTTESQLWDAYVAGGRTDDELRNLLVLRYLPGLQRVAKKFSDTLPKSVTQGECESAAVSGLLDAIGSFDPTKGNRFWTYASRRVNGAICDWLRSIDRVPRGVRACQKRVAAAEVELAHELGQTPNHEEIRDRSGIDHDEYELATRPLDESGNRTKYRTESRNVETFEVTGSYSESMHLDDEESFRELTRGLSLREQTLLFLYYHCQATMKSIGVVFGLSESRVSQMHSQVILQLRKRGR
jgi:RNA polymerase sigma factor for flagellar operon FliA